jgi:hypothetical protein
VSLDALYRAKTFNEMEQGYELAIGQIVRMVDQPDKWLGKPRSSDDA